MNNRNFATLGWVNVALAVLLLVGPWVLGFAPGAATANSVICALLIGGASLVSLTAAGRWTEWRAAVLLNLVVGVYLFQGPLLFHYNADDAATWIHMVAGTVIALVAGLQMWRLTAPRLAT